MRIFKALCVVSAAVSVCVAQSINISGKITDTSGTTPISGAVVRLENGKLSATSGPDGSFSISGTIGVINHKFNNPFLTLRTITIRNGFLLLTAREKSNLTIGTYTLHGKALSVIRQSVDAGAVSIKLPIRSAGVYFHAIKSGKDELVVKENVCAGMTMNSRVSDRHSSPESFAKQAKTDDPITDVLAVTKDGQINYRLSVKTSDTSGIEIKMIPSAGTVTDVDSNAYQTVKIGTQVWTVENLRTRKYNDGAAIELVEDEESWPSPTMGFYCYYGNTKNADSIKRNGALYNWSVVNSKKLAPGGWHVPTKTEWETLQNYLIANGYNIDSSKTENKIASALAAKADWKNTNCNPGELAYDLSINNRSGFSGLPSGWRSFDGYFECSGSGCAWWSASESGESNAWGISIESVFYYVRCSDHDKKSGLSVRLVKD